MKKSALIWLLLASSAALAADPIPTNPSYLRCMNADDDSIASLIKVLDDLDTLMPQVPPEELVYLEKEFRATMDLNTTSGGDAEVVAQANRRFNVLIKRPLYYVWDMRKTLRSTRDDLEKIVPKGNYFTEIYRDSQEASKADRAAKAMSSVSRYMATVSELPATSGYSAVGFTKTQWDTTYIQAIILPQRLGNFIQCKVAKVVESMPKKG